MSTEPPKDTAPVGRPSKYDPSYCDRVEAEMAKGYSLTAFAGILGVNRDTIDEWRRAHPEFSEAVTRAKALRLLQWERAGMKVASSGGGSGQSTMIIFGLKNMGGEEWQDISRQEQTGPGGGPLAFKDVTNEKRLEAFMAFVERTRKG